jgi:hypothetical protein
MNIITSSAVAAAAAEFFLSHSLFTQHEYLMTNLSGGAWKEEELSSVHARVDFSNRFSYMISLTTLVWLERSVISIAKDSGKLVRF